MIKNYLLVIFRNLLKNKLFTFINILGLGIALAVCIVAFFNHMFDYGFDRQHEHFNEIYRITCFRDMQGREQEYGVVPSTLGLELKKDVPGIKNSARLQRSVSPVKRGDDVTRMQISYVDPEFLEIFTFETLKGDLNLINENGYVLLSEEMALNLFGSADPLGKPLVIINDQNQEFAYTIGGIFRDFPENSSFRIDALTHFENFTRMWNVNDPGWRSFITAHFIRISDKSLVQEITDALKSYLPVQNRVREDFKINRFTLVPMKEVGDKSRDIWSSGLFPAMHPAATMAPPVMAIFILLIACFNFANTSIAIFSKRLKEIALRKTFGGIRSQLVTQFLIETMIICTLALFAGLLIAAFLVPAYSNLWAYMTIKLTLGEHAIFWVFLVFLVLATGFLAGVYPAMHVSAFNPVNVMKGTSVFRSSGKLSMILLTLQFSISVTALVMGIVFARNAGYQKTLDLGYDRDKLIVVPVPPQLAASFRNDIISDPRVISAGETSNHIGWGSYRRPVKDAEKQLEVDILDIGPEYAQTMGLRLTEGRLFERNRTSADRNNNSIIVNRKMLENFGWENGTGKSITMSDTIIFNVVGVVEDFYTSGLWEEIEPAMLRLTRTDNYSSIAVRADSQDLPEVLETINEKWKALGVNYPFDARLQEDLLQEEKDINGSILKVNLFLAFVASILSLIGMFNLVSIDIIKRTKEVGIRKIQGAPLRALLYTISRKFIISVLIASALGCAGGYYMSLMLLDSIWDYFVNISFIMLLSAAGLIIVATFLTVFLKILRAALRNPAESLRYE